MCEVFCNSATGKLFFSLTDNCVLCSLQNGWAPADPGQVWKHFRRQVIDGTRGQEGAHMVCIWTWQRVIDVTQQTLSGHRTVSTVFVETLKCASQLLQLGERFWYITQQNQHNSKICNKIWDNFCRQIFIKYFRTKYDNMAALSGVLKGSFENMQQLSKERVDWVSIRYLDQHLMLHWLVGVVLHCWWSLCTEFTVLWCSLGAARKEFATSAIVAACRVWLSWMLSVLSRTSKTREASDKSQYIW